jgi:hypothetical protein
LNPLIIAQQLWQALPQRYDDITAILRHLAANCRTCLLHDYRSLVIRSTAAIVASAVAIITALGPEARGVKFGEGR